MTNPRTDKQVEVGHSYAYEVMLGCREDLVLNLTRRKWGIAFEQKLDSSHIKCSKTNRTYREDKEKETN